MKVYSLALVAIISTTGCQAFSPVSLTGQSKAARHVIFRPRQPLFAEEAPQVPIVKVMDPPPPPPVVKIMDPPAPAPAAAVVVPPPAPAMPAPVSTITPPPATTAQAVELEELRTELKEAEKQNEEIKQEMKAMESKVEKMESQVEKITTEATKPAPAPTTPPPPPKPTPEELRAKAEDEARKEKLRKEAEVAAKKVQDEKARLQKAEDEKKALVDKLNSVRKTDAVKKDLKPSLPRTIPFDPNASTNNNNNNNNNVMTMMKPPALPNFDPSSVTKEKATIAGGILGALVLGRFVLSSREEVKDEAATKRQTKSIRSTIAIKDASGKPKKEKASTRIAKAAAKVANKQLEKKGESAPTKSASAPAPAPASTTGSTTSTPAPVPVPVPVPVPAPPTASSTTPSSGSAQKSVSNNGGSYLDSLGGSKSSSSAVKSSYSPFGSKPKAAVTSNNFMYTPPGVNPTTPSTPAKENKHQETPPMAASSYAPFGANDAPPKNASPFDSSSSNGVSSPPPYSPPPPAQNETPAAPSQQQQQQQQQSPLPPPKGNTAGKTSYLPYGKKPQGKPWWNSPK
ncbi:unnamed protein product [Cylindrotheca closterium]|uniref:Uncharacterized protein n=1 Tax=Cylindrotheca closterium TaxID=2856 RepID=A0AAD2FFT5_9STRA|nr:unnamed protein product [Cylindrotheca closterium]